MRNRELHAWLPVVCVALCACQSIAGIDDLKVREDPRSGRDAGTGGTSTGTSGQGGKASAGQSGRGGSSGEGGTGGSGDSTTGPDGAVLEDGAVADDAATADGCDRGELKCDGACVANDARNCGRCGHDCTGLPFVAGKVTCDDGRCVVPASACASGHGHCSNDPDDGCETDLTKPAHCGTCDTVCDTNDPLCVAPTGGNASDMPHCVAECNGDTPKECDQTCVDPLSNPSHCGGCSAPCDGTDHGQGVCDGGECAIECNSEYCGSTSCTACENRSHGSSSCSSDMCAYTCDSGYDASGDTCVCHVCAEGQARCSAGAIEACGNITDGCGQWGAAADCSFGPCFDATHCMNVTPAASGTIGSGASSMSGAIAIDDDGKLAVTGSTSKTFDGQPATTTNDAFISSFGANLTPRTTRLIDSDSTDYGHEIAYDAANDHFIIAGTTYGVMHSSRPVDNEGDVFVESWDLSGTPALVWGVQFGTSGGDSVAAVAVDSSGNVFVSGYTQGAFGSNTVTDGMDPYLAKIRASDGAMLWATPYQWVDSRRVFPTAIAFDDAGNVILTGDIQQDGGPSSMYDVMLSQWSASTAGAPTWVRTRGTSSLESVTGMTRDDDGNFYVVGRTGGSLDGNGNAGGEDAFLMRFDPDGVWDWTEQWGTQAAEDVRGVTFGHDGSLYVVGSTDGAFDGYTNAGLRDNFVSRWLTDRTLDWTLQWGTSNDDGPEGIVTDAANDVFILSAQGDANGTTLSNLIVTKFFPAP